MIKSTAYIIVKYSSIKKQFLIYLKLEQISMLQKLVI